MLVGGAGGLGAGRELGLFTGDAVFEHRVGDLDVMQGHVTGVFNNEAVFDFVAFDVDRLGVNHGLGQLDAGL